MLHSQNSLLPGTNPNGPIHHSQQSSGVVAGSHSHISLQQRREQINSLKVYHDRVSEIEPDCQYRLDFDLPNRQPIADGSSTAFALIVYLGSSYPVERPTVMLIPPSSHPWVNESGYVVGAPGLLKYTRHSTLGQLILAIKREFTAHPPTPKQINDGGGYMQNGHPPDPRLGTIPSSSSSAMSMFQSPYPAQQGAKSNSTTMYQMQPQAVGGQMWEKVRSYKSEFTGLEKLAENELKELLNNETALKAFLRSTSQFETMIKNKSSLDQEARELRDSVESASSKNVELVAKAETDRETLFQLNQTYFKAKEKVSEALEELRLYQGSSTPGGGAGSLNYVRDRLSVGVDSAEETSDATAERFTSGEMKDWDQFLKTYLDQRIVFHSRKSKHDKAKVDQLSTRKE